MFAKNTTTLLQRARSLTRFLVTLAIVCCLMLPLSGAGVGLHGADEGPDVGPPLPHVDETSNRPQPDLSGLPSRLHFEANMGQYPDEVAFTANAGGQTVFLTDQESVHVVAHRAQTSTGPATPVVQAEELLAETLTPDTPQALTEATIVRMQLHGDAATVTPMGIEPLPGRSHYLHGDDPDAWITDVPHYSGVILQGVYPGIDLVYYGTEQGTLKYDFIAHPGSDPDAIRFGFTGTSDIRIDEEGRLELQTPDGPVLHHEAPFVYQSGGDGTVPVASEYTLDASGEAGFLLGAYDPALPLIIDPEITLSTFLGGAQHDSAQGVVADDDGRIYVAGHTTSVDFPTVKTQTSFSGTQDAFVTKLDHLGNVIYSAYLGGRSNDQGLGIDTDGNGNAYIVGTTRSTDFPTLNAYQPLHATSGNDLDGFLTKLDPNGQLVYSTYVGGTGNWYLHDVAVDDTQRPHAVGRFQWITKNETSSPTGIALQFSQNGDTLNWQRIMGSNSAFDEARGVALDPEGNVYVAGYTNSATFSPLVGAIQSSLLGTQDGFLVNYDPNGFVQYGTYLGLGGNEILLDIVVDGKGGVYAGGATNSSPGNVDHLIGDDLDLNTHNAWLVKVRPQGTAIEYQTLMGGSGTEVAFGVGIDNWGHPYLAGYTNSNDLPLTDSIFPENTGGFSTFVTKFVPAGDALVYNTYLAGTDFDVAQALHVDLPGHAYVAGQTRSPDYPLFLAFQEDHAGGYDAFVTRLSIMEQTEEPIDPEPTNPPDFTEPDIVRLPPLQLDPVDIDPQPLPDDKLPDRPTGDVPPFEPPTDKPVPGPDLPRPPRKAVLHGPEPPQPVAIDTQPGPAFPQAPEMAPEMVDCPECPASPELTKSPALITAPDVPTRGVQVPLREHSFDMDWTLQMDHNTLLHYLSPIDPETLPLDALPEPIPGILNPPPHGGPGTGQEDDLLTLLSETTGLPLDAPERPVPVLFEVHTESNGTVKRTPAVPFVPILIDVDDNPTTGALGYDIMVRVTLSPFMDEVSLNITRLAPLERHLPGPGSLLPDEPLPGGLEPFPDRPLDLTMYAIVPLGFPSAVETVATPNPETLEAVAVGYTTDGQDAPAAVELNVRADSLMDPHPNSRFEIGLDTWRALDNFTLLAGFAELRHTGPKTNNATGPIQHAVNETTGQSPAIPETGEETTDDLVHRTVNTTRHSIGYRYENESALLASISFQPPPHSLGVDVSLPTDLRDPVGVLRIESEANSDVRVVITDETRMLSEHPVTNLTNLRVDKMPRSLGILIHEDRGLPSVQVDYQGDLPIARLHAVQADDFDLIDPDAQAPTQAPQGPDDGNTTAGSNAPDDATRGDPDADPTGTDPTPQAHSGDNRTRIPLEGDREAYARAVAHLNLSDLPDRLRLRVENGTDLRIEGSGPIGQVHAVAANNMTPLVVRDTDGLFIELIDDDRSRYGLVLRGLEEFRIATNNDDIVMEWSLIGDQPFGINATLHDEDRVVHMLTHVSNMPSSLHIATDAQGYLDVNLDKKVRTLVSYIEEARGGTTTELGFRADEIPATFGALFDIREDRGDITFTTSQPLAGILAEYREAAPTGTTSLRLQIEDLPGFKASWVTAGGDVSAVFDAEGDGVGAIDFRLGGTHFLHHPQATTDHAFLVQDPQRYPEAPDAMGLHVTGLKHVGLALTEDTLDARIESRLPTAFTLYVEDAGQRILGEVDKIPGVVDFRLKDTGDGLETVYQASQAIDRLFLCGEIGPLSLWTEARDIPEHMTVRYNGTNGTAEWLTDGPLGRLQAHAHHEDAVFGGYTNLSVLLQDFPETLRATHDENGITLDALGDQIGLVEFALHDEPGMPLLPGLGVYYVEPGHDTLPAGISVRVPGFMSAQATFDDGVNARLRLADPTPVDFLFAAETLGGPADVRAQLRDLADTVQIRIRDDNLSYMASQVLEEMTVHAALTGPGVETHLHVTDLPEKFNIQIEPDDDAGRFAYHASGILRSLTSDTRLDPTQEWNRLRLEIENLPHTVEADWNAQGVDVSTLGEQIGRFSFNAAKGDDLVTIDGDHVMITMQAPPGSPPAPLPVPDGTHLSAQVHDLKDLLLHHNETQRFDLLVESRRAAPFVALAALPDEDVHAALRITDLPAKLRVTSDLTTRHTYHADSPIGAVEATFAHAGNHTELRLEHIPEQLELRHFQDEDGDRFRFLSSSVLERAVLDMRSDTTLFAGLQRAHLQIDRLPAEAEVFISGTNITFRAFENPLGRLAFMGAAPGEPLQRLPGDHAMIIGQDDSEALRTISAEVTDLRTASLAKRPTDDRLELFVEQDRPAPFTGCVILPTEGLTLYALIQDIPDRVRFTSDLEGHHIWEASGVIGDIFAYLDTPEHTSLFEIEELPTRLRVDLTETPTPEGDELRFEYRAHERLGRLLADVVDKNDMLGDDLERARIEIVDMPTRLSATVRDANFTVHTDGDGLGSIHIMASDDANALLTHNGAHALYHDVCTAGGSSDPCTRLSARLTGLVTLELDLQQDPGGTSDDPDRLTARFETTSSRPFLVDLHTQDPTDGTTKALIRIEDLPERLVVRSDLKGDHVYEASSGIGRIHGQLVLDDQTLGLLLEGVPGRIHLKMEDTGDEDDVLMRYRSDLPLLRALVDITAPGGVGDTDFKRLRADIHDLGERLDLVYADGGDRIAFDAGETGIGKVQAWASTTGILTDQQGSHVRHANTCTPLSCQSDLSVRVDGLKSLELVNTTEDGLRFSLVSAKAQILRVTHTDTSLQETTHLEMEFDPLPSEVEVRVEPGAERIIYTASRIMDTLLLDGEFDGTRVTGQLESIPERIELDLPALEDETVIRMRSTSSLGQARLTVANPDGILGDPEPGQIDPTIMHVRVVDLPSFLEVHLKDDTKPGTEGDDLSRTYINISTAQQGIGLIEAAATTRADQQVPQLPAGNAMILKKNGDQLDAAARLAGFEGVSLVKSFEGDIQADLQFTQSSPLSFEGEVDGTLFTGLVDPVPRDLKLSVRPERVTVDASRPIDRLEADIQIPGQGGAPDTVVKAEVRGVPDRLHLFNDGVIRIDSSGPIARVKADYSGELGEQAGRVQADMKHVPPTVRIDLDLDDDSSSNMHFGFPGGIDDLWLNVTFDGVLPVISLGSDRYVYTRADSSPGKDACGDPNSELKHLSMRITAIEEFKLGKSCNETILVAEFIKPQILHENKPLIVQTHGPAEDEDSGTVYIETKEFKISTLPERLRLQIISDPDGNLPRIVEYEATEIIGELVMFTAGLDPSEDYTEITLRDVPKQISLQVDLPKDIAKKLLPGEKQEPWGIKLDASTEVDLTYRFYFINGDSTIDLRAETLHFQMARSPWDPTFSWKELAVSFPFTVSFNTENQVAYVVWDWPFLVNECLGGSVNLFGWEVDLTQCFKLAPYMDVTLIADKWLFDAELKLGVTGFSADGGTVGGHVWWNACLVGVHVIMTGLLDHDGRHCIWDTTGSLPS